MMYLYHIFKLEDYGNLSEGYVGVTINPEERLDRHFTGLGSIRVFRALEKYGELGYSLITSGSPEEILRLEKYLRPKPMIGWNLAEGGGMPPNHAGKVMHESQKKNISESNKRRQWAKKNEVWVCDGVEFISKQLAAEYFGCLRKTVKDRCDNPKFENWFRKPTKTF